MRRCGETPFEEIQKVGVRCRGKGFRSRSRGYNNITPGVDGWWQHNTPVYEAGCSQVDGMAAGANAVGAAAGEERSGGSWAVGNGGARRHVVLPVLASRIPINCLFQSRTKILSQRGTKVLREGVLFLAVR